MNVELEIPRRMLFDWKKLLFYVVPLALLGGIFLAKMGTRKGKAEEEYVSAMQAFNKWDQILDCDNENFSSLEKIIKKHPELHAHYDALIGQNLLAVHSPKKAMPYIERTLKRTNQPYYSDYARNSICISEGKYEEALEKAYSLKENMMGDGAFWEKGKDHSSLFAFNLIRIATLCHQLENKKGELEAWKEIKQYGGWDVEAPASEKIGQEGFVQLLSHFSVQETTLLDYIASREEELSKN
ncbi:MAG: hypothetical protein KDK76_03440 [Chlamydiia bacterium]|nr:hypothetical protein [Chlamydiia bacterium]